MPIVNSPIGVEEATRAKEGLLLRITEAQREASEAALQVQEVIDWSVVKAEAEEARQQSLREYKDMIDTTLDIPLEKLLFHSVGCDLFDDLCLRLDVNQRFAFCTNCPPPPLKEEIIRAVQTMEKSPCKFPRVIFSEICLKAA